MQTLHFTSTEVNSDSSETNSSRQFYSISEKSKLTKPQTLNKQQSLRDKRNVIFLIVQKFVF